MKRLTILIIVFLILILNIPVNAQINYPDKASAAYPASQYPYYMEIEYNSKTIDSNERCLAFLETVEDLYVEDKGNGFFDLMLAPKNSNYNGYLNKVNFSSYYSNPNYGSWTLVGAIPKADASVFSFKKEDIISCNFPLKVRQTGQQLNIGYYTDFYIQDNANLLSTEDVIDLLELERKFEANLNCQFFVRTISSQPSNEQSDIINFSNSKCPQGTKGNGSLIVNLNKANGRIGLALSENFLAEISYQNHQIIFAEMKKYIGKQSDINGYKVINFLQFVYNNCIYEDKEPMVRVGDKWKNGRTYTNPPAGEWVLYNHPLTNDRFGYPQGYKDTTNYNWSNESDFYWERQCQHCIVLDDNNILNDGRHVWFDFVQIDVTPIPSVVPTPLQTMLAPIPTPTNNSTPKPYNNPPKLPNDFVDDFTKRLQVPVLTKSYDSIMKMNTSRGTAPVIKINLAQIFNASMSKQSPNIKSPFKDEETIFLDFGQINTYKFLGMGVVDYFRMIIGFGFILMTIKYAYDKIWGGNTVG